MGGGDADISCGGVILALYLPISFVVENVLLLVLTRFPNQAQAGPEVGGSMPSGYETLSEIPTIPTPQPEFTLLPPEIPPPLPQVSL